MSAVVRRKLSEIVQTYGLEVCDDPRRCEAFLRDFCGQYRREIFVLVSALKQNVIADLQRSYGVPHEVLVAQLTNRLHNNLGIDESLARWSVESWAFVLKGIPPTEESSSSPVIEEYALPPALPDDPLADPTAALPEYLLRHAIQVAWVDGHISRSEHALLRKLQKQLGVSSAVANRIYAQIKGEQVPAAVPEHTPTTPVHPSKGCTVKLPGGVPLRLVLIPAGTFRMGDKITYKSEPVHEVSIAQPFFIGQYQVTHAQWYSVLGSHSDNPQLVKNDRCLDNQYPVEKVSWYDCQQFIEKLNTFGLGHFRLPTEAEWEYACRAGTQAWYCFGDDEGQLGEYAWYNDNSTYMTNRVGKKRPNAWGLYDMHGNVWEWCQDFYHDNYNGAPTDGTAWDTEPTERYRVVRGGAYSSSARVCRAASRSDHMPSYRHESIGFRVVLER